MADFRDLLAYKKSFSNAMEIFELTKSFPKEEKYSLIDQIRRSSRSVCANLSESYRKRKYPKHFIAKLSDADMENSETMTWLEFSLACKYIDSATFEKQKSKNEEAGKLIGYMINNYEKFLK